MCMHVYIQNKKHKYFYEGGVSLSDTYWILTFWIRLMNKDKKAVNPPFAIKCKERALYFCPTHGGFPSQFVLAIRTLSNVCLLYGHNPFLNAQLYHEWPPSLTNPGALVTTQPTMNPPISSLQKLCIYIYRIFFCMYAYVCMYIHIQ